MVSPISLADIELVFALTDMAVSFARNNMPLKMAEVIWTITSIMVAVVFCKSFSPTVAIIKMGPVVEQKLAMTVAAFLSASLSAIAFAPIGYPQSMLVKNLVAFNPKHRLRYGVSFVAVM